MDYKDTLNLPSTSFPMKAGLPQREPAMLEAWEKRGLYEEMLALRGSGEGEAPRFLLHDGPPYANGSIHIGHALNKVLKDIVRKYRHMAGAYAPYRPGWDCHGLPIELEVEKKVGRAKKAEMGPIEVRRRCAEYARKFVASQRDDFRRLGVLADWDRPYLTLSPGYEAGEVRELAAMMETGALYRGLRPVHWCASCRTALAEAEVDYDDHTSTSVYVRFPFVGEGLPAALQRDGASLAIWTTTPWTLPANLAVAVNPRFTYALAEHADGPLLVAADMLDGLRGKLGLGDSLASLSGEELEGLKVRHPWIDRDAVVILGDHVTLEAGTGCVHTAPGHGHDDYVAGQRYGLEPYAPVDDRGCFTAEVPEFAGRFVFDTDDDVVALLDSSGALLAAEKYRHSYPHCWRCRKPIVFRATEQWFASMEHGELRRRALDEIDRVRWIPRWGRERIYGMVASRPDWCLSRQRVWGVPIVALRCKNCGTVAADPSLMRHVADVFEREGSDAWYADDLDNLLPDGFHCSNCQGADFDRLRDILDVWFDSGVSYSTVIEEEFGADTVSDLYLEGSDQHRGWFHTSLLTSVATRQRAPYAAVLTHGFVLDGDGRKMSKSLGNVIAPQKIINQYGADIVRLWVAAEDYRDDVKISAEILKRLADSYRRIRNTARNMLGNLHDYDPNRDGVAYEDMVELDRWALLRLHGFLSRCTSAYESYEFHVVYHALNNFCSVDLSALYFDIIKDRLYCSGKDSLQRRSAQTAMHRILSTLTGVIAPILSFTAEEIWQAACGDDSRSVFLTDFPRAEAVWDDAALDARWQALWTIRGEVTTALERARKAGDIGHSLDSRVLLAGDAAQFDLLDSFGPQDLAKLFIVSQVELESSRGKEEPGEGKLSIRVLPALGSKCDRCWNHSLSVGSHAGHATLCDRCCTVVTALA